MIVFFCANECKRDLVALSARSHQVRFATVTRYCQRASARRVRADIVAKLFLASERATLIQNGGLPSAANLPGKPQRIAIVNPPLQYPIAWSRSLLL